MEIFNRKVINIFDIIVPNKLANLDVDKTEVY